MSKRLIPSTPYLPVGGMAPDRDSLSLQSGETVDLLNLRVLQDRLVTRSGTTRVSPSAPSGDPILHMHRYKDVDGSEILFGFTQNGIYKFAYSAGMWVSAMQTLVLAPGESAADWIAGPGADSIVFDTNDKYLGTGSIRVDTSGGASGDLIFSKYLNSELNNTYTHFCFYMASVNLSGRTWNFTIELYRDAAYTQLIESGNFSYTANGSAILFTLQSLRITPNLWGHIGGFKLKFNGDHSDTESFYFDYVFAESRIASDVTSWSSTNFTDFKLGSTVVAAGSAPPSPNASETDKDIRKLIYYDRAQGFFKMLSVRSTRGKLDERVKQGAANSPFSFTLANRPVVPGTVFLRVRRTNAKEELFQDNQNGYFAGGAGSGTIDYNTGQCVLYLTAALGANEAVYADYFYYAPVTLKPRFVYNLNNRLVFMNNWDGVNYQPWQVTWSNAADATTYSYANRRDLVDDDISPIVGAEYQDIYLVIMRHHSKVKMKYVGGDQTFGFYTPEHEGAFAGRTMINYRGLIYFLGKDDFYVFDGTTSLPLGKQRIATRLMSLLNVGQINNCFSFVDEKYDEIHFAIVTRGSGREYAIGSFVYSVPLRRWSYFEYDLPIICAAKFYFSARPIIDQLQGTIDEQHWQLNAGSLSGSIATIVLSMSDGTVRIVDDTLNSDGGYVGVDDNWVTGAAIPIRCITADFIYSDLTRFDRTQRLQFEAYGNSIDIGYSPNYEAVPGDFNQIETHALTPDFRTRKYFPDVVSQKIRFILESEVTQTFQLRWLQTFAVTMEKD